VAAGQQAQPHAPLGPERAESEEEPLAVREDGTHPIAFVRFRQRARVRGRVRTLRVQPLAGSPTLECVIADDTGQLSVVFLGRREVAGVEVGRTMLAEGVLGEHHGRLCILNPHYQLLAD
jgi:RecG-like helicase